MLTAGLLILSVAGYTGLMARVDSTVPPDPAPVEQQADAIRVEKSARKLILLRDGQPVSSFRIALGSDGDGGHKQREGDERTPEGRYFIDWRNPRSIAHLSLHISYPNAQDQQSAEAGGYSPGGNIMIHGLPNGWGWLGPIHHLRDWTDGCIAVTDAQMREIWAKVPDGTPIDIVP